MSEKDVIKDTRPRMEGAVEDLRKKLATIRTGRAAVSLLDSVVVEYYGTPTPLNQLAGVSVPEPRLLVIQPWDRGTIGAIERAIQKSELGLNPSSDGQLIRIGIPPLTEERRKQLVRLVHNHVEEGKVAVRNIRRDAIGNVRDLFDERMISEDDERRGHQQVEDLAKRFVDEADKIGKAKEQEVLEV